MSDNQSLETLPVSTVDVSGIQEDAIQVDIKTAAQARVESVACALDEAYKKASMLVLTPEEAAALSEDFPDEAFSLGAGGDPNLIYIEHAYLRQRLNRVLGIGAAVPVRRREWAEEFETYFGTKRTSGIRIYADMCLLVRGALVGEAVGCGVYYKSNARSTYDDALESAMSNAFRRCCKQFGVGLQVWMKGWCDGWKQRKAQKSSQAKIEVPKPKLVVVEAKVDLSEAKAKPSEAKPEAKEATEKTRAWFLKLIEPVKTDALSWARDKGILLPNEALEEFPLRHVPTSKESAQAIIREIEAFASVEHPSESDADAPSAQSQDHDENNGVEFRGYLLAISKKETKRAGSFRYGMYISPTTRIEDAKGAWVNTFSKTDYDTACGLKGKEVKCRYTASEYGSDLVEHSIEEVVQDINP